MRVDRDQDALGELIIADDDPTMLDLLSKTLGNEFHVSVAANGSEAIELLKSRHPVAILCDEMMPGASGTDVLEVAKELHPHAARMLMTAATDFTRAITAVNRGEIHRFFLKPLRPVETRDNVREIVQRVRREELLRAEVTALAKVRQKDVSTKTRVLGLGLSPAESALVNGACGVVNYDFYVDEHDSADRVVVRRPHDVLALGVGQGIGLDKVIQLARTIDESVAVVLLDDSPTLEEALKAHERGVSDYIAAPFPSIEDTARRLQRAVHAHQAEHDTHRLTANLLGANRDLAQAQRRIEEEQVRVLNAMIRSLEARDPYTAGHTDRVAAISVRLAQRLGHDSDTIERIRVGALVHDIGKIGIRDEVLLKPGKLSVEEFQHIQLHPVIGFELIENIAQFAPVLPIVRNHHEKLDGTGYPDGLATNEIADEVRIVSVADVLDAVTSTRPYREGSDVDRAFMIMNKMRGGHLDPEVLDAMEALHQEGRLADLLHNRGRGAEGPTAGPNPY